MTTENKDFRKIARNFIGRIELMKKTPLKRLESIFLELYELGLQDYLKTEMVRFPDKSRKDIIRDMYKFHEKLKGRKKQWKVLIKTP